MEPSYFLGSQRFIVKKPRYFPWLVGYLTQSSINFQVEWKHIHIFPYISMIFDIIDIKDLICFAWLSAWDALQVWCSLGHTTACTHLALFWGTSWAKFLTLGEKEDIWDGTQKTWTNCSHYDTNNVKWPNLAEYFKFWACVIPQVGLSVKQKPFDMVLWIFGFIQCEECL